MKPCILFYLKDSSKSFALGVVYSTVHHGVDRCQLVWRSVGMLPTYPERLDPHWKGCTKFFLTPTLN